MGFAPAALDPALVAAILDLSADAIMTVSPGETVTSWNRGATALFGWRPEEILGRHFSVLVPDDLLNAGELEWIHSTTQQQGAIRDHETRRRRKDGTVVDVSLTRTAVHNAEGALIGFSAILRDISDRKRLERQLLAAERLATAGQVAAGVAHEIGAPLTAITMMVERMLKSRCATCAGADQMVVLRSQTDRIARLARDLVHIAKPSGLLTARMRVEDAIGAAAALVRTQLAEHQVRIAIDHAAGLPLVRGDTAQLQQVLINLLLNADHALLGRGGTVRIATRPAFDGGAVEIEVRDDGPGIAAADVPRLFTPFFSRGGGTGLGLAIAAQIVQAHHGTIEASSEAGRGATFTIRLPAHSDDD